MPEHRVFVYGTLRDRATATHKLYGYEMYSYHGKFPYILPTDNEASFVCGNLLEVGDEALAEIDHYEGIDRGLYSRKEVEVVPAKGGNAVRAFVYVSKGLHPKLVQSGDWFNN